MVDPVGARGRAGRAAVAEASPSHWIDVARLGIQLARKATVETGRESDCAVAFAISEEVNSPRRRETIELLARMFADDPPDMLLLETLTLIRDPATFEMVELLLETGLPVWLSYRRCRHGVCGVYGQHWGPPEGDLFGRAARRFEEMGVEALMINCLPVDHVPGIVSWLRDFTELPLGVYPNLGHLVGAALAVRRHDRARGVRRARARLARGGRADHRRLLRRDVQTTSRRSAPRSPRSSPAAAACTSRTGCARPSRRRPASSPSAGSTSAAPTSSPCRCRSSRSSRACSCRRTAASWSGSTSSRHGRGAGLRCLDVGCGCGIQTVQLALNGAEHVHAIDIDRNAIANTVSNAYRNGVGDRVSGDDVDLYQWTSDERYDLVVASLYQMPVDPYEEPSSHRPLDYWGRNQLDHFLGKLPGLLTDDGRALVMQLSIVGQAATSQTARPRRADGARRRLHLLPVRVALQPTTSRRSSASSSSPTRTTSHSAATTSWSPT